MTIKSLPESGMVTVDDLANFLGNRVDFLKRKLREKNVPVIKLSSHSRMQMVSIQDLKMLK